MQVNIQLPPNIEERLRDEFGNLERLAKESLLVSLYRQDKITKHELATILGIDRFQADELLSRYGVIEDLPSAVEITAESQRLESQLGR